jgi:hypothetical protein
MRPFFTPALDHQRWKRFIYKTDIFNCPNFNYPIQSNRKLKSPVHPLNGNQSWPILKLLRPTSNDFARLKPPIFVFWLRTHDPKTSIPKLLCFHRTPTFGAFIQ